MPEGSYQQRWRQQRIDAGLCVRCNTKLGAAGGTKTRCPACAEWCRKYNRQCGLKKREGRGGVPAEEALREYRLADIDKLTIRAAQRLPLFPEE